MIWGLSESALQERRAGIGGSDARVVVHGTPEERYALWQEKVGEKKPKKIMGEWAYALRYVTEGLQLDWYEHQNPGCTISRRGEVVTSRQHRFMRCTLDGFVDHLGWPINCKHVSRWTKEAREWCIEHYTPQITHEAIVCEADYGMLSLLHGEKEPELIQIEVDPFYREELIEREREFWNAVVEGVPPKDCLDLDTPKAATPVVRLRNIDLSAEMGTPEWAALVEKYNWAPEAVTAIGDFTATDAAAKRHAISRETLKGLVPEDVGELRRGGFVLKRSKAGAVTMKLENDK